MSSTVVASALTRKPLRDPVLLLPAVVGIGLAIAWLGTGAGVSGTRIATDLALSWALVAASLVALERQRWRRSRVLLTAAAFALLAADLQWSSSAPLWTLGFLLGGVWGALLVQGVLTFPEGRPWARAAWVVIAGAYAVTLGGQLIRSFVLPDSRDLLSVAPQQDVADAIGRAQALVGVCVGLAVLALLVGRLRVVRGPARRAQAPLLLGAALTVPVTVLWLIWVSATGEDAATLETIGRALWLLVPLGVVGGIVWPRLSRSDASDSSSISRPKARPVSATASPACSATRRWSSRIGSTMAATSMPRVARSNCRRAPIAQ